MSIDYSGFSFPKDPHVRLEGAALTMLRLRCLLRDHGRCRNCHVRVSDSLPDWHPLRYHMAHIVSRGAGGEDVISNVRTLCGDCHRAEHQGRL